MAICGLTVAVLLLGATAPTTAFLAPMTSPFTNFGAAARAPSRTAVQQVSENNRARCASRSHSRAYRPMFQRAQLVAQKTFNSKDFNINWNRPDAQGSFGRVYFAKQGFLGGQVVVKIPFNNNFALNTFETERFVNQRLDSVGSARWAKYLGDFEMDPSVQASDLGTLGMVFKKEGGESLEDLLVDRKDVGGKVGARGGGVIRPELAKKVMKELFMTCQQMHSLNVFHRDIKPESILVTGGSSPLKLIDFGSSCDLDSKEGLNQVSLDPIYAPPEKRMQPNQPGKFDVYSVAMVGMRCLLPSFSSDPRPGISHRDGGCVTLVQEFAEVEFPKAGCNLEKWGQTVLNGRNTPPQLQAEVEGKCLAPDLPRRSVLCA